MTLKPTTHRSMLDALTAAGRLGLLALAALFLSPGVIAQTASGTGGDATSGGPMRLRQPRAADAAPTRDGAAKTTEKSMPDVPPVVVAPPGEF